LFQRVLFPVQQQRKPVRLAVERTNLVEKLHQLRIELRFVVRGSFPAPRRRRCSSSSSRYSCFVVGVVENDASGGCCSATIVGSF